MERILITYDDPQSQELEGQILEPAGYDVITAAYGPIAMEVLSATQVAIGVRGSPIPHGLTFNLRVSAEAPDFTEDSGR